jgi:tetratricopeptide (TPR) repeat protein
MQMPAFYFVSYSRVDDKPALKLADELGAGPPVLRVWLDRRELKSGQDWDEQIVEALRSCEALLFLMTPDSVSPKSECKREWTRALQYKKPVIPLLLDPKAELPYRLEPRQYVDFTGDYTAAIARLRKDLTWRSSAEGVLHTLRERLEDAERDLARAEEDQRPRIEAEINQLQRDISEQHQIIADPQAAEERARKSIERGIERERAPEVPISGRKVTKFINPPPLVAPTWFQNRHVETKLIGDFLKDAAARMITVVGRAGIGKTAMACRLLKSLEGGELPDNLGALPVDGIVYLSAKESAAGTHRVSFESLYFDLCELLEENEASRLDRIYKDTHQRTQAQMQALLNAFPQGRTIVLLDNFENVVDTETFALTDSKLDEALRTALTAAHHGVKLILTTRVAPRELLLIEPARHRRIDLDEGLEHPYAENILREMDADGRVGLKTASDDMLDEARERTRGYPRALEALYGILSVDRDTSLPELLQDTRKLLPENVVEVLVGEAFNRLDPGAQQVMQALAIYGTRVPPVAVDYLLQPYVVGVDSAPILSRLVNMQFVRRDATRYYLHQVDRDYALSRIPKGRREDRDEIESPPFTQYALRDRGASYFSETRKPRENWRNLNDLAPQLAEFELRVEVEDFDTAGEVVGGVSEHLHRWGYFRLTTELLERLSGKIVDPYLEMNNALALGAAYWRLANYDRVIERYEDARALARTNGSRAGESSGLIGLGNCCRELGDYSAAIDFFNQSLATIREIGDRPNEGVALGNLGNCYSDLGQTSTAVEHFERAVAMGRETEDREGECHFLTVLGAEYSKLHLVEQARSCLRRAQQIADEIGYTIIRAFVRLFLADLPAQDGKGLDAVPLCEEAVQLADEMANTEAQFEARLRLTRALLELGELENAQLVAEEGRTYNFPRIYPKLLALCGVIALRRAEASRARRVFREAVVKADDLLRREERNLAALDAKALARCGLALAEDASLVPLAVEAYRAARAVNSDPGVIASVLQDLDVLAPADPTGLLKPALAAASGKA